MPPPPPLLPRAARGQSPTPGHTQGQSQGQGHPGIVVGALEIEGGATHDLQGDEGMWHSCI